jgi:hypothetical protein
MGPVSQLLVTACLQLRTAAMFFQLYLVTCLSDPVLLVNPNESSMATQWLEQPLVFGRPAI